MNRETRSLRAVASSVVATLCAVGVGACNGSAPAPSRPNVLFIVVDTLRWDHVDSYGALRETTPAIDRLAAGAIRFERAYSTSSWTIPAVASMITGMYPSRHTATSFDRRLPAEAETLAEVLRANGYATAGVVSHAAIGSRRGFDQGYDVYLESEARGHDHVSTQGVTRQAVARMEAMAAGDEPFLLFVHYFDPHYNYKRHPEYGFAPDSAGRLSGGEQMQALRRMAAELTPQEVDFLRALYDEEIRFTDAGIGRLLERLDALGLREETLIVFTADHGEGFLAHGHLGHTSTLYEELVRVPLILRPPGPAAAGRVVRRPASVVALTPTILDLVGVDASDMALQAGSLTPWFGGEGDGEPIEVYCEVDFVPVRASRLVPETHKQALIGKRYKAIRDGAAGRLELYDLGEDAEEAHDLAERRPALAAELAEGLERWRAEAATEALDTTEIRLDEAEIERLEALGYVGED